MNYFRVFALFAVVAVIMAAFVPNGAEAGARGLLIKKAALAALLTKGGKKILLPLPIPIPLPVLKQTQPIYYQQPSYSSYNSYY